MNLFNAKTNTEALRSLMPLIRKYIIDLAVVPVMVERFDDASAEIIAIAESEVCKAENIARLQLGLSHEEFQKYDKTKVPFYFSGVQS